MSLRSEEEGDSVVTVGSRPTLPTFYVDTHEGGGQTTQESQPGHLRFRNRSADSAVFDSSRSSPSYGTPGSSSLNFVSPADSGLSTPMDSGVEADDSFGPKSDHHHHYHAPPKLSLEKPNLKLTLGPDLGSSPGSYLFSPEPKVSEKSAEGSGSASWDEVHRRFFRPRSSALFDSSVPLLGSDQVIPMLLMLIVLASSVFTVLMLKQGLTRGSEEAAMTSSPLPNGKYASIEFGLTKRTERLKAEGKILPEELADEEGRPLKGKRAAMQFAYEVNNPDQRRRVRKAEEEEETPDNSDVQFNLDLKGLADLLETKDSDPEDVADSKKKLIEKIGKFGHFTTTKVGPKSEEVEKSEEKEKAHKADESEDEQESQEKAEAKRETKSTEKADATSKPSKTVLKRTLQTARENPLRSAQSVNENLAANKGIIGREDDPFRFVQN